MDKLPNVSKKGICYSISFNKILIKLPLLFTKTCPKKSTLLDYLRMLSHIFTAMLPDHSICEMARFLVRCGPGPNTEL